MNCTQIELHGVNIGLTKTEGISFSKFGLHKNCRRYIVEIRTVLYEKELQIVRVNFTRIEGTILCPSLLHTITRGCPDLV